MENDMKPRVRKRGNFWEVRMGTSTQFTSLIVDDWNEAMRIAGRVSGDDHLALLDVGILRMLGKQFDSEFTI